jgi:DNA-binding NarL/FixJ family response regulator
MATTAKKATHGKTATKPARNKRPKKVLIVDGHPGVPEYISDVLSGGLGLVTVTANTAEDARLIAMGPKGPFDLVITNMELGKGMNGLELIRWLEKESPATHGMLMSSSEVEDSHVVTFLKPIRPKTLTTFVQAELGL